MKIFIKLFLLFISLLGIVSCTPRMMERLWNGYYSQQKAVEEYDKKRDAFYAKETIEQKELRKKIGKFALIFLEHIQEIGIK
ncbi:hypothetical protein [Rodentibacter haemolyticus]|uniref:Lipoprotein n=1 Tax=Rodentibacter haemolyticus TaxID=2778911 RepID=A0ABX6UYN1_9PAST|nr:hypothetical protein [Rodentibacter haemolyticus]QPB43225.1 hypothetical protein IHV77_03725 [Rodentibacter haemolyticus]